MAYLHNAPRLFPTAALVAITALGCKRPDSEPAEEVPVSPVANPGTAMAGARERPVVRVGRQPDDPDAAVSSDSSKAAPRSGLVEGQPEETDEEQQARERREARRRTEAAVDKALQASFERMRACYEGVESGGRQTTLKFRLHRSGYLVSPQVSTGNSALDSCLSAALNRIRVSGVETDSLTLERTVRFSSPGND